MGVNTDTDKGDGGQERGGRGAGRIVRQRRREREQLRGGQSGARQRDEGVGTKRELRAIRVVKRKRKGRG